MPELHPAHLGRAEHVANIALLATTADRLIVQQEPAPAFMGRASGYSAETDRYWCRTDLSVNGEEMHLMLEMQDGVIVIMRPTD